MMSLWFLFNSSNNLGNVTGADPLFAPNSLQIHLNWHKKTQKTWRLAPKPPTPLLFQILDPAPKLFKYINTVNNRAIVIYSDRTDIIVLHDWVSSRDM